MACIVLLYCMGLREGFVISFNMLELSIKVKGLGKHGTRTLSLVIQGVRFRKKTAKKYISIQLRTLSILVVN